MLLAIEELLFLDREANPIAHSIRWRRVSILTFSTGTFRQCVVRYYENHTLVAGFIGSFS